MACCSKCKSFSCEQESFIALDNVMVALALLVLIITLAAYLAVRARTLMKALSSRPRDRKNLWQRSNGKQASRITLGKVC